MTHPIVNRHIAGSNPASPAIIRPDRKHRIAVVGAGLSGAAVAFTLATRLRNVEITVFDQRGHVGGNVHTAVEPQTGVMVHQYGPHIFHTNDEQVWNFFDQFAHLQPYTQRTKGITGGEVYSLPINLHTISQYYRRQFTPEGARDYIQTIARPSAADNFESYAISLVGENLYAAFLRDYTLKQWGRTPKSLPSSILKRLPMRFDYNDNAYDHKHQGIPALGYTHAVQQMLESPAIKVVLGHKFLAHEARGFEHVFSSAPIDEWFGHSLGKLSYRTLDLTHYALPETADEQGCSVLNLCDASEPWTRRTEHKHFMPWKSYTGTVITEERPREHESGDIHYYPVGLPNDIKLLEQYQAMAHVARDRLTFVGRLGTYRYLDMDRALAGALAEAKAYVRRTAHLS